MLELDQAQDGLQQSLIMVNDAVCGAAEFIPVASRSARTRLGYSYGNVGAKQSRNSNCL